MQVLLKFIAVGITLVLFGCENNFQPIKQDHSLYFSIYGVLDASADTNWIRVSPVRESILTSPDAIDATVTITEKSTGEKFELNPRVINPFTNYIAINFWTTADIKAGEEYLFEATNSEGETSWANIIVPDDFPTPIVDYNEGAPIARTYVNGVENLVVASIYYYYRVSGRPNIFKQSFSQLSDVRPAEDGVVVFGYPASDKIKIFEFEQTAISHLWQEVQIISGGPAWPSSQDLPDDIEDYLPQTASNIQNGVGVLAGAVSKTVLLESCFDENENLIACPLLDPATPWY